MTENYFNELNHVDLTKKMEKKGQFAYLSWAHCVTELGKRFPEATWAIKRFPMVTGEWVIHEEIQVPYLHTPQGFFVEVAVTVNGVIKTQVHPVLDHRNKPVASPDSFQLNTSIQRCLAKAIALHGLSLHIFAGEDLPQIEDTTQQINPDPVDNKKIEKFCADVTTLIDGEYVDAEDYSGQKATALRTPLTNDEAIYAAAILKKTKPEGTGKTYASVFREVLGLERAYKNSQPAY